MKKTFLSKIPVLGLILTGIFLVSSASGVVAQTTTVGPPPPQGPFLPPSDAIEALDIEIVVLKTAMLELTEGTQAYKQLWAKYSYFSEVRDLIVTGKSVQESIVKATEKFGMDVYEISEQTLLGYQAEVIDIVS